MESNDNIVKGVHRHVHTELYDKAKEAWPHSGRHILAQHDDQAVLVYQAYNKDIGEYAVENGYFEGAPGFKSGRMTWIKTNFLWMMYRSGWGTKPNQDAVLGIWLKKEFFEKLMVDAGLTANYGTCQDEEARKAFMSQSEVRLQWDPDHLPDGTCCERRAIQLGMKGNTAEIYATHDPEKSPILEIVNMSEFVSEQRGVCERVPVERVMEVPQQIFSRIGLSEYPKRR